MSIAKEVRNLYLMHVGSNAPVSLSDMEIEFSKPTEIKVPEPLTEEEVEEMIRQSKMRWAAMLNANSKE